MSTFEQFLSHPIESLERALHIRKQIDQLNENLKEIFSRISPSVLDGQPITTPKRRGKRRMSAEARARIANAQRLRWAKSKGLESATLAGPVETASTAKPKKKRGGMSAEGRARIVAAQKARWAKVKAQKFAPTKAARGAKKKKRTISAAHRAKLKAAAKARWARVKKA